MVRDGYYLSLPGKANRSFTAFLIYLESPLHIWNEYLLSGHLIRLQSQYLIKSGKFIPDDLWCSFVFLDMYVKKYFTWDQN